MKKVQGVYGSPRGHWVGNGFPVRSLFSYDSIGNHLSPFLLLDYAGPYDFVPGSEKRGVGAHPHRGFETVTIVYQGELEHRDSIGAGGIIGPGDVQWMTAGAGILHEEFHSQAFTQSGGTLEMIQLWVNLPAKDKMTPASYQTLLSQDIKVINQAEGRVRVIAGDYQGHKGAARTFSPLNVWDLDINPAARWRLPVADGHTAIVVVLQGAIDIAGQLVNEGHCVVLAQQGADVEIATHLGAKAVLLTGVPLDEPVVGYGPFVMNTHEQIRQALFDLHSGGFGKMSS